MYKRLCLSLIILCVFITGCRNETTQQDKRVTINQEVDNNKEVVVVPNNKDNSTQQVAQVPVSGTENNYIKFLFPDHEALYWLIEEKEVKNKDLNTIINTVIKDRRNPIPKDTKLLGVSVKDGIAFVNLSKEFETFNLGSAGQLTNIFSIVNVLCLNEQLHITSVRFLIEGKEVKTIGPIDTSEPLTSNIKLQLVY